MAYYLVTGGAGFIGFHLPEALVKQQHQVTVLLNWKHSVSFAEGPVRTVEYFQANPLRSS